ncbi:hypothetical protein QVE09_28435 [Paenibacillus sp. ClWae2A]|uniref:hypothetical protein n=1 Tax=Paenibacillus sp. ClWae2A TaxID=3057177 RepID=UPI0028F62DE0|nr:hypothetical protein [Paenibacillus sp. ClWae2A]MDT9722828.1 hypothetical protein [Paenibacillus sp. ClWae2A]
MMATLGASTVATLYDARQKAPRPHSRGAASCCMMLHDAIRPCHAACVTLLRPIGAAAHGGCTA